MFQIYNDQFWFGFLSFWLTFPISLLYFPLKLFFSEIFEKNLTNFLAWCTKEYLCNAFKTLHFLLFYKRFSVLNIHLGLSALFTMQFQLHKKSFDKWAHGLFKMWIPLTKIYFHLFSQLSKCSLKTRIH